MKYSFIIPVFNRPDEIRELLESFNTLSGYLEYEIVIIEDGSPYDSKAVVEKYKRDLNILYLEKENSGPGDSRNYGMKRASGDYFIILDSDCLLPPKYLEIVNHSLELDYVDCFGGPDNAHESFNKLQQAINFAMTSVLTTGGVRGGSGTSRDFEPRSFNMGLSKEAFEVSGGFGRIHPGEDPDLAIRLKKLGYKTKLIQDASVFHKRRVSWSQFYRQVQKFGLVRPILNKWHPTYSKLTYWFPTIFCLGFVLALIMGTLGQGWLILLYILYFLCVFVLCLIRYKDILVAGYAILAVTIQFFGYGSGFLRSFIAVHIMGKDPEQYYPKLFFK